MSKSWLTIAAILFSAILAVVVSHYAVTGAERKIHVTIRCTPDRVSAFVNGKSLLTRKLHGPGMAGSRLGLYIFKSFEASDKNSWFRNLRVYSSSRPPVHLSLLKADDLETGFEMSSGWVIEPGKGLFLDGRKGTRGICLLKDLETLEFVLDVDILQPVDVGIFFAASDAENGQLLILRPFLNDVFFTFLKNGEPGPVLEIGPFTELDIRDEALRLAGLIGNLIIRNALFLVLLWWIARRLTSFESIKISRFNEICTGVLDARSLPLFLFFATFMVLACVALYSLDAVPHIADESVYLFQARIFAAGHLWAPAPLHPDFFAAEHVIVKNGRWFGKYPPFFPFLLSLGVRAGVPWLVNPLIGAFSGLMLFFLTTSFTGSRRCGVLAWLLLLTSPFFLLLNASMMAHGLALLLTLLFVYLACRGLVLNSVFWGVLSGLCIGGLILTRPFTALLVFLPMAIYILIFNLQRRRFTGGLKYMTAMGVGVIPVLLFWVFWHNLYLPDEHHFLGFFYSSYHAGDLLGFGPDRGKGWLMTWGSWGHTPAKGFRSVYNYLSYTGQHLFGWPLGLSFAFLGIPLFFGRHKAVCFVLFSMFLFLAVGHMFYWATQHLGYGARYWFSGMAGLIIPTVYGVKLFRDGAAEATFDKQAGKHGASLFMVLVLLGLTGWNMLFYLPERLNEGHHYGNVSADLKNAVEDLHLDHSLVFVKTENLLYNDGFFMNDPFMKADLIFARDLGEKNQSLIDMYPGYDLYRWDKKVLTQILRNKRPSSESIK